MNIERFWMKATDFYNINHDKYCRAILTEEEKRDTATDFLTDIEGLAGEWYNSGTDTDQNNSKEQEQ